MIDQRKARAQEAIAFFSGAFSSNIRAIALGALATAWTLCFQAGIPKDIRMVSLICLLFGVSSIGLDTLQYAFGLYDSKDKLKQLKKFKEQNTPDLPFENSFGYRTGNFLFVVKVIFAMSSVVFLFVAFVKLVALNYAP